MIGKSYQVGMLSNLIQQAELRHQVISQNIANVNTPGYRSQQLTFDSVLDSANDRATSVAESAQLEEVTGLPIRQDGNNVDIDRELGHLTKNAMHFETLSQLLASKMSLLRSAITGQ